jgi:hypothetical protein
VKISDLLSPKSAADYLARGLDVAVSESLPVTTWRVGDPTKTLFVFLANAFGTVLDPLAVALAKSAFIDESEDDWATVHAASVFGVERVGETYATPTARLQNHGGGVFEVGPGDVTLKSSVNGVTYHSTAILSGVSPLTAGETVEIALVADVPGSAGSIGEDDIDLVVTTMPDVDVVSSTAGVGLDAQDLASLQQDCYDSRGALSPNGPPDAYQSIAKNHVLTGLAKGQVSRARSTNDSSNGHVTLYVCDADGESVDLVGPVQDAIVIYANPLCFTPTTNGATKVIINLAVTVTAATLPDDPSTKAELAVRVALQTLPIAGDDPETVYLDAIRSSVRTALSLTVNDNVVITSPGGDVVYTTGQVPVLGTFALTVV